MFPSYMEGRSPSDFLAKKIPIQEAMEMYFQLMESYALDAGMALQCRRDPRLFFWEDMTTWVSQEPIHYPLLFTWHGLKGVGLKNTE